jgi:hypothetical protein
MLSPQLFPGRVLVGADDQVFLPDAETHVSASNVTDPAKHLFLLNVSPGCNQRINVLFNGFIVGHE